MYEGEKDCKHWRGIRKKIIKKCCGGKKVMECRVDCAKIHIVVGHIDCRRDACGYYESKGGSDG